MQSSGFVEGMEQGSVNNGRMPERHEDGYVSESEGYDSTLERAWRENQKGPGCIDRMREKISDQLKSWDDEIYDNGTLPWYVWGLSLFTIFLLPILCWKHDRCIGCSR